MLENSRAIEFSTNSKHIHFHYFASKNFLFNSVSHYNLTYFPYCDYGNIHVYMKFPVIYSSSVNHIHFCLWHSCNEFTSNLWTMLAIWYVIVTYNLISLASYGTTMWSWFELFKIIGMYFFNIRIMFKGIYICLYNIYVDGYILCVFLVKRLV